LVTAALLTGGSYLLPIVASCGLYVSLICGKRRIMENRNQCYKF
jgi:fructose-specific phosphotransferase system IIC component